MADFLQLVSLLREQMHASLSRTDVLRALIWPIAILLIAILGLAYEKAPDWLIVILTIMFILSLLLYGASYVFCLLNDRDALRSEKYSLHKIALEHGLVGDSSTGLMDLDANPKLVDNSAPLKIEGRQ
jgi:hypothetical protein